MAKFRSLIDVEKALLLFYTEWHGDSFGMKSICDDVGVETGVAINKIDADKNQELCDALRIKNLPVIFIYSKGEMLFRESGTKTKEQLIELLKS